jgi:D-alanine-D-alanine ligase
MRKRLRDYKIGVLLGGESSERKISLKSGSAIYEALKKDDFNVVKVDVKNRPEQIIKKAQIDMAFIALHGHGGEDGYIQQVLEKLQIPYTGSAARASLNAFDKACTKAILKRAQIDFPKSIIVTADTWQKEVLKLELPVFMKPVDNGSSIGVHMASSMEELEKKMAAVFLLYDRYIIEQRIDGREITIGILGKKALPIIELRPSNAFYDFRAKYTAGKTRYLIPAKFPASAYKKYQKIALKTHCALGAQDFSRVDMIIDQRGKAYVLELNSIPGFTATSLLPKAAQCDGIEFAPLCEHILELALRRYNGTKKTKKKKS